MTDIHISYPSSILVPREAYRYWPSSEFILRGSGKKSSRFIFENQTLTAFEQEKLSRLIKEFQKKRLQLPATYSTNHLLRFCYGGGWKTKKSLNGLIAHLNWIQTAIPGGYRLLYPKIFALLVSNT